MYIHNWENLSSSV